MSKQSQNLAQFNLITLAAQKRAMNSALSVFNELLEKVPYRVDAHGQNGITNQMELLLKTYLLDVNKINEQSDNRTIGQSDNIVMNCRHSF